MNYEVFSFLLCLILYGCISGQIDISSTPTATLTLEAPTPTASPLPSSVPTSIYSALPVISILNASELIEISRLTKGIINQTDWMPDGKSIIVATTAGVYIYNVATGGELQFFESTYAHPQISVDSNGQFLATSEKTFVRIWDVESGQELRRLADDGLQVKRILFHPERRILAVEKIIQHSGEGESYEIRETQMWDATTGELLYTLMGREHPAFSPDGRILGVFYDVSLSDQKIEFWDSVEGQLLFSVEGNGLFAFNPNGISVAVENPDDDSVTIWDMDQWDILQTFNGEINRLASEVFNSLGCDLFSSDGNLLALYDESLDRSVQLWDLASGEALFKLSGGYCLNFSTTERVFASNGALWNATTGAQIRPLGFWGIGIFSPDGRFLLKRDSGSGVYVADVSSGEPVLTLDHPQHCASAVAFSPDGRHLASGGCQGMVHLWSIQMGETQKKFQGLSYVNDIVFSPDGQTIAAAGIINQSNREEAKTQWWDISSGSSLYEWQTALADKTWMVSASFAPDGKTFAALSLWDNVLRLWDTSTRQLRYSFVLVDDQSQRGMAFSANSQMIALATSDRFVKFWDVYSGQQTNESFLSGSPVQQLVFSDDGHKLFGAGYKTIWVWDMDTKKLITTIESASISIRKIAVSPDGNILAIASWKGNNEGIDLLDVSSQQILATRTNFSEWIPDLDFSPDGRLLVTASADGTIRFWGIKP